METVHSTSTFSWGHEITPGYRTIPPELIPVLDDEGEPVISNEGQPVLMPPPDWTPQQETLEFDTMIIVDRSTQETTTVFKVTFGKEDLANFLSYYVEHLDVDGRKAVREAMEEASGILTPKLEVGKLELVKT